MRLRAVALVLVLANLGFLAWWQGWLGPWSAASPTEPQRLTAQIQPQAVRVLTAPELQQLERAEQEAARNRVCLRTAVLSLADSTSIQVALERTFGTSLAWSLDVANEPARWIVYMGRYANATLKERKQAELRQLGVAFETLRNTTLEPGLSLGHYPSEAEAREALASLAPRGVRSATVVLEQEAVEGRVLRLPSVDEAGRAALGRLPELASRPLQPC